MNSFLVVQPSERARLKVILADDAEKRIPEPFPENPGGGMASLNVSENDPVRLFPSCASESVISLPSAGSDPNQLPVKSPVGIYRPVGVEVGTRRNVAV